MEIKTTVLIFVLLYTVHCSPTKSNDFDMDEDYDLQNDDGVDEYDTVEESKMPKVPLVPVKIITPEQEFIRDIGETVTLPCEIIGSSFVHIWSKNSSEVLFQSGMRMTKATNVKLLENGSLEIFNLHVQDAGEYKCIAMETKENSPEIKHRVILRAPPQIESLTVKDNVTLLKNGDTLVLTCKASGYPKAVISWHKGSSRYDMEGEVLKIEQVKHRDAGTYKCLADNKIGEPAFSYIEVKVEFKPVIAIEKVVISSENNSETELECLVHSEPRSAVVWLKDGKNVVNTERTQLVTNEHKHNLILKDLRDSDFGVYTCSATNPLGTTQKNISLVRTPAVHRFKKSQTEAKVVLTWEVQSKSDLAKHELLYRRKGENDWKSPEAEIKPEVSSSGNGIYEVKYILSKGLDPGEYETKFRSKNYNGWSTEYSALMTIEVYSKHGHHKSHKKGHKHGKEKQTTPTPIDVPAEHHENDVQSGSVKQSASPGTESSDSSSISSTISPISIALFAFLQVRLLAWMRI